MTDRLCAATCAFLALLFADPCVRAAPLGLEFRANTHTAGAQLNPAVAKLTNGFVIVWTSAGQDGSGSGIYAQRYASTGVRVGREFRVNTRTANHQTYPSVAGLKNGGFVVVWHSDGQDGSALGVYAQRFDAGGKRAGVEFRVNTHTAGNQYTPSVAGSLTTGGFVVTWTSDSQDRSGTGIYGQRYSGGGVALGSEFRVNTFLTGNQVDSSTAPLSGGGYVVTWTSGDQDGSLGSIQGQRYTAAGVRAGGEFQVNTRTFNTQFQPSVAGLSNGGFVIVWSSFDQDGSMYGVYGQRYSASGARLGGETRINTRVDYNQFVPSVAALAGGHFLVTWASFGQDVSGYGVGAQRYTPAGVRVGAEFRVNTYTSHNQGYHSDPGGPAAAPLAGGYVVTWPSYGQDSSDQGIYGQRFN